MAFVRRRRDSGDPRQGTANQVPKAGMSGGSLRDGRQATPWLGQGERGHGKTEGERAEAFLVGRRTLLDSPGVTLSERGGFFRGRLLSLDFCFQKNVTFRMD